MLAEQLARFPGHCHRPSILLDPSAAPAEPPQTPPWCFSCCQLGTACSHGHVLAAEPDYEHAFPVPTALVSGRQWYCTLGKLLCI